MLCPESLTKFFQENDLNYFNGVPDSFLANLLETIPNKKVSPNEGSAIAHAAGYQLATGKIPIIYMQNSGLGNAINPLTSLVGKDAYSIPMLLLIGWRGSKDISDEPQHQTMGENLKSFLEATQIEYEILSLEQENAEKQITNLIEKIKKTSSPKALLVKKNSFKKIKSSNEKSNANTLIRKEVIKMILSFIEPEVKVLSTTGHTSRELMSLDHFKNSCFYNFGAMGHISQLAQGLSESSQKRFICLDGEGSLIMHLGNIIPLLNNPPKNLTYIVFNNSCHLSVGGQETAWKDTKISNYFSKFQLISNQNDLEILKKHLKDLNHSGFFEILVKDKKEKELPRPELSLDELKKLFTKGLH